MIEGKNKLNPLNEQNTINIKYKLNIKNISTF